MTIYWINIAVLVAVIVTQICAWRRQQAKDEKMINTLESLVENQDKFTPILDKLVLGLKGVWSSQETQRQVTRSHKKHDVDHAKILAAIEKMQRS